MTMTDTADREKTTRPQMWLWGIAAAASLGLHAGGAAWVLRQLPVEMADNAPPPAIMIEMAAEPEAVNTEENNITQDRENAEAAPQQMEQPLETPQPEELADPVEEPIPEDTPGEQPVEDAKAEPVDEEAEQDPIEEQVLAALENVEVPIPVMRPKPAEEEKSEDKPKPRKTEQKKAPPKRQASAASQAQVAAAAQVRQSNRNAASQTVAGMGFGSVSPAKWQSRLMAHLERRKKYPPGARSRREQGTVHVRFSIDDGGNVLSASLARSSGFPELDAEVLALVRRASPVPAPPPGVNRTITAPVRFTVR